MSPEDLEREAIDRLYLGMHPEERLPAPLWLEALHERLGDATTAQEVPDCRLRLFGELSDEQKAAALPPAYRVTDEDVAIARGPDRFSNQEAHS